MYGVATKYIGCNEVKVPCSALDTTAGKAQTEETSTTAATAREEQENLQKSAFFAGVASQDPGSNHAHGVTHDRQLLHTDDVGASAEVGRRGFTVTSVGSSFVASSSNRAGNDEEEIEE